MNSIKKFKKFEIASAKKSNILGGAQVKCYELVPISEGGGSTSAWYTVGSDEHKAALARGAGCTGTVYPPKKITP